jgi:lipopolysaccharide biosynthesis glycosyltransferase
MEMNIALCFSNSIAIYAPVLMASICENHKQYKINFFLLCECDEDIFYDIKKTSEKYDATLNKLELTEDDLSFCERLRISQNFSYLPDSVFYRLLLPYKINVDRFLSLDIDIIINGDISDFYFQDMTNYEISAVNSVAMTRTDCENFIQKIGLEEERLNKRLLSGHIFGAGIVLYDLTNFTNYDWVEKNNELISVLKEKNPGKKTYVFGDQGLLNYVFCTNGKLKLHYQPDLKWAAGCHYINSDFTNIDQIKLIHYIGQLNKPWNFYYNQYTEKLFIETNQSNSVNPELVNIWWKYVGCSSLSDRIIKIAEQKIQLYYLRALEKILIENRFEQLAVENKKVIDDIYYSLNISKGQAIYDSEFFRENVTEEYVCYTQKQDIPKNEIISWVRFPLPKQLISGKTYRLTVFYEYYSKQYCVDKNTKNSLQFLLGGDWPNNKSLFLRGKVISQIEDKDNLNVSKTTFTVNQNNYGCIFFSSSCMRNAGDYIKIYSMTLEILP